MASTVAVTVGPGSCATSVTVTVGPGCVTVLVEPLPPAAAAAIPITANSPTTDRITVRTLWREGQDWRDSWAGGSWPCGAWPGPAGGGW